jgi:hypothetical protein
MGKTNRRSSRKQKVYKMVGCSKKTRRCKNKTRKTRKNHLGGSSFSSGSAYNGGSSCGLTRINPAPLNINGGDPNYPNTGPPLPSGGNISNNALQMGGCGCNVPPILTGGSEPEGVPPLGFMIGGTRHRKQCRCSACKSIELKGGNGLTGSPYTPSVGGVQAPINYPLNTYNNDVSRQMTAFGGNPPFTHVKGGKRKQKGGSLSNFLGQDLVNLGRQFQFGVGSAYSALAGQSGPVNPLPWKDHLPSKMNFNAATI